MTHYVAIEMGIAGRALTLWQEAGEELITQMCVQQVFLTANTRPGHQVLEFRFSKAHY